MRRASAPLEVRKYAFWSQVALNLLTGCWEWTGNRNRQGYGMFMLEGLTKVAHRLSYEWEIGPIPVGLHVLHRCDNPPCVNPQHLSVGTREENMRDMVLKGRHRPPRGAAHWIVRRRSRLAQ